MTHDDDSDEPETGVRRTLTVFDGGDHVELEAEVLITTTDEQLARISLCYEGRKLRRLIADLAAIADRRNL
jgi:hypothetical protein